MRERADVLVRAVLYHSKDSHPRLYVRLTQPDLPYHRKVARRKSLLLPSVVASSSEPHSLGEIQIGLHIVKG